MHLTDGFSRELAPVASQSENLDGVTSLGQGFRVAYHPVVRLVEAIDHHTDPPPGRRWAHDLPLVAIVRDISRESVPTGVLIPRLDVAQEFLIERFRVGRG